MTGEKEQTYLLIKDSIAFLYIDDSNGILRYKPAIDEDISNDKIVALAVIWNGRDIPLEMSRDQKEELFKWLNALPILSIAVVDNYCHGDLLELIMMCDIRLGGNNLFIRFPQDEPGFVFDFEERCQLLMGKEGKTGGYGSLLNSTMDSRECYNLRLINQITDMVDTSNEVQSYISSIMSNKGIYQIKAIIKCFNNYKHLGLNSNRELLLEQESKQFCNLIVKEYLKK